MSVLLAPYRACLVAATVLVGCHGQKTTGPGAMGSPAAARAAPARPGPDLRPGPPIHPSPLTKDPLWRQAAGGAPIDLLREVAPGQITPVLGAVQAVIAEPPQPVEALDPEGMRSCAPVLEMLEKSAKLSPHERDLAASARAMLGERL